MSTCRVCGCTDAKACEGGCYWVEADLCSACALERAANSLTVVVPNDDALGAFLLGVAAGVAAVGALIRWGT